jgi:hypothetical protein
MAVNEHERLSNITLGNNSKVKEPLHLGIKFYTQNDIRMTKMSHM